MAPAGSAVQQQRTAKIWKLQLLDYTDSINAEETLAGFFAEFKALGLVEGRDYELKRHSAHGDMAVLNGIVLISCFNQLREQGRTLDEAIREGTLV